MSVRRAPIVSVPTTCPSPRRLADLGRQCRALATAVTCVLGIAGILTVTIAGPAWAQGGGGAAGPGPTGSQGAAGTVVRDGGAGGPPRAGGSAQTVETMRSDLRTRARTAGRPRPAQSRWQARAA